jgi:hypothetical protein
MPDSSLGGFLPPSGTPPLSGAALYAFLQAWLVGVTGLPGTFVRPSYQPEPPDLPNVGTVWLSFNLGLRTADTFPYIVHNPAGLGSDTLQRHEQMEMLCTFYDLGIATALRDGAVIPQNCEYLSTQGFKLVSTGDFTPVPVLLKQRWQYRVDLPITLRRQIDRTFAIDNLASAQGTLYNDAGYTPPRNIGVPNP